MQESDSLRELVEKDRIAAVIHRLFVGTDAHDWDAVRECLADSVLFDMTSLAGGEPARLTPRQITEAWEAGLRPIEAIHQQAGNLIERGEQGATASCYGIAYYFRRAASGRNTRVFVGSYDFRLRREVDDWKIDLFRFNVKFVDGNLSWRRSPVSSEDPPRLLSSVRITPRFCERRSPKGDAEAASSPGGRLEALVSSWAFVRRRPHSPAALELPLL